MKSLLFFPAISFAALPATVLSHPGAGSIFKQKGAPAGQEPVVLRLTDASSIGASTAVLASRNPQAVKVGELFALEKMVVAENQRLRVWASKPLPESKLQNISAEIVKLKKAGPVEWIDGPIKQSATHFLEWDGTDWNLSSWSDKTRMRIQSTRIAGEIFEREGKRKVSRAGEDQRRPARRSKRPPARRIAYIPEKRNGAGSFQFHQA